MYVWHLSRLLTVEGRLDMLVKRVGLSGELWSKPAWLGSLAGEGSLGFSPADLLQPSRVLGSSLHSHAIWAGEVALAAVLHATQWIGSTCSINPRRFSAPCSQRTDIVWLSFATTARSHPLLPLALSPRSHAVQTRTSHKQLHTYATAHRTTSRRWH